MSGQALDLKRSAQIVRRHKIMVGSVAALGLLAGAAYAILKPPMLTSQTKVVLPPSVNIATQEVIATSAPVLAGPMQGVDRGMSLDALQSRVVASRVTSMVISISANGATAAQAEATANAVTDSYVAYIGSDSSPVGKLQARFWNGRRPPLGRRCPAIF